MAYQIDRLQPQSLGRVGDGGTKTIQFDCTAWIEKNPGLTTWCIDATRPNGEKYTPAVKMDGNILSWPITRVDTQYAGYGKYMIIAEGNDGTQKTSASPPLIVLDVLSNDPSDGCDCGCGGGNSSGGMNDIALEELMSLVTSAETAANKANEAVVRAEEVADRAEAIAKEATERANDAAEKAEEAAERAEAAAENAEDGCDCTGGSVDMEHDGAGNVVLDLIGLTLVDDGNGNISIV